MRAVHLNDYGSPNNFEIVDVPIPEVGPDEVRVRVHYAGLRWGDIMQRQGLPSRHRPTPFVAGQEAAGEVDAVGASVTSVRPGQRVVAMVPAGAFAEYVVARPEMLWPVPPSVLLDRALAYPVNMRTAHLIVYAWAKVQDGETVLLHAAAGGLGLLILQILKRRFSNVRVLGICSSPEKEALLKANGCDHVINRKTRDYVAEVTRICGPKATGFAVGGERGGGVDVVLNGVSGPTLATDPMVIRKRGRWVIYGYSAGHAVIDTSPFGYDGITIMPFSSIAWFGTPEADAAVAFTRQWLAEEDLIQPHVWPLEGVAAAQDAMEAGNTSGKVVFKVA